MSFLIFTGMLGLGAIYHYGTVFEKTIIVDSKYDRASGNNNNIYTSYMLCDKDNNIYSVNRSLYWLSFDNAEKWNKVKENKKYQIKGYGFRIPILSLYPNLIDIKKLD
jgi:hypothetical protein